MSKIKLLLQSRKFWAAFVGIAMMFVTELAPDFPLDGAQVERVVWILMAYILGTGIEDSGLLHK